MNNRKFLLLSLTLLLFSSVFITSCKEEDDDDPATSGSKVVAEYDAEAALRWHKVFLEVERYAAGYRPGPAPRALGLMSLAAYEACITGMPDYNSLEARFAGLNLPNVDASAEYHWPAVVHGVYTTMMPFFFLSNNQSYNQGVMQQWNGLISELNAKYAAEAGEEVFNRSLAYGNAVGQAMIDFSTSDTYGDNAYRNPFGNYNTNESYDWAEHYDGPGDWVPTTPGPTSPMGPFYGNARGWVLSETEKICLPPSVYFMQYSEDPHSEYYSQALQVYTKNAQTDYITEWIGEYWSDDLLDLTFSPGPRWTAVANQIIENEGSNLETALEAYAKSGMALSDAAKGAWASKFYYNVERPDTYIKKVIDSTYRPNLDNPLNGWVGFTPPFPAYPSGHSTMGAAGAEALASVFGYSYAMTDNCHVGRTEFEGTPRSFGSLYEMALENAWSRVLLGVHWRMDCDEGVRFGTVIGRKINALPWKK